MAKISQGVTKSKRIHALRQVLARHGRLRKDEIDQYVAAKLAIEVSDAFGQAIYRDLRELVADADIEEVRLRPDGRQLDDYDPEKHKNTVAEWGPAGGLTRISGEQNLKDVGGEFLTTPRLERSFKIDVDHIPRDFETIHLFFNLKDQFYCLKLAVDAVPASIVLARRMKDKPASMNEVEAQEGHRSSLLLIPVSGVSSSLSGKRLGHVRLEFTSDKKIEVTDLGSTNGTSVVKLTSGEADKLITAGHILGSKTLTTTWSRSKAGDAEPLICATGEKRSFSLPILVQVSDGFRVLIV